METINYHEHSDLDRDPIGYAIIVLTTVLNKDKFEDVVRASKELQIECTIAGHSVPFTEFVKRLHENYENHCADFDRKVRDAAVDLLRDHVNDLANDFSDKILGYVD